VSWSRFDERLSDRPWRAYIQGDVGGCTAVHNYIDLSNIQLYFRAYPAHACLKSNIIISQMNYESKGRTDPLERTNRSRLNHFELFGLALKNLRELNRLNTSFNITMPIEIHRENRMCAAGAIPIGAPMNKDLTRCLK
jgi:hypothetical protein